MILCHLSSKPWLKRSETQNPQSARRRKTHNYGDGSDMDTENTKDVTTGSSTSPIPDGQSGVATLTPTQSPSSAASMPAAEKETGTKAQPEKPKVAERPKKAYEDQPPQGTPQEWAEIVYQFSCNAKAAGLPLEFRTIRPGGSPTMIIAIPNGYFCGKCGHPNLGDGFGICKNCKQTNL